MNLESEILQVNLDDIIPNRFQPRIAFDEQGLKELSDSIREHGIIQPLVLRKLGNKYEIIAGERRYKAATMAGLVTVPAVISNIDDNKSAEVALVENIQRRDLTPIEEARSYKSLLDKGYLTQEQLAKKMGLSQPAVANKLRLLNLDEEVQQALLSGKISERHARALLAIKDTKEQVNWLNRIINERLTVRQLDTELKKINAESEDSDETIPTVNLTPDIEEIKRNATDIVQPEEHRSVESMMVPENIMTEYSNSLPKDVMMSEPIVMDHAKEETTTEVPQQVNKFFDFTNEEPVNMNMGDIYSAPKEKKEELEVFDMPIIKEETKVEEIKPQPKEEVFNPQDINQAYEFNPQNKFFKPLSDGNEQTIIAPQPETLIDPMSVVDQFDPSYQEEQKNNNQVYLIDAINDTRKAINELNNKGFNVNVDEIDLDSYYQITVKIFKDN